MATRKLSISEMRAETAAMEEQVKVIETALSKLNSDVLTVFDQGWNSANAITVKTKIETMETSLTKIKDNIRLLKERIDTHIGNVENVDTING